MIDPKTLRDGDRVTGSGRVEAGSIVLDPASITVTAYALAKGDAVSWLDGKAQRFGEVALIEGDPADPATAVIVRPFAPGGLRPVPLAELRREPNIPPRQPGGTIGHVQV
jgi:hypothetical protein